MTGKRFINDIDIGQLIDTKGELSTIDYSDKVDFYELWEFLNKLNDENEQLKYNYNEKCNEYCGLEEQVDILLKENEQLKKENYELHKRLGDFKSFEQYMKERTSKTSVNDIIGLVKTDEPTNSVELKKELYE